MTNNEENILKKLILMSKILDEKRMETVDKATVNLFIIGTAICTTELVLTPSIYEGYVVFSSALGSALSLRKLNNTQERIKILEEAHEKFLFSQLDEDKEQELPKVKCLKRFHSYDGTVSENYFYENKPIL